MIAIEALETGNCRELSGHVLDEIIDEKLTKSDFFNGMAMMQLLAF